jgi:hypothetical protein
MIFKHARTFTYTFYFDSKKFRGRERCFSVNIGIAGGRGRVPRTRKTKPTQMHSAGTNKTYHVSPVPNFWPN